jgi:hypothetical protein
MRLSANALLSFASVNSFIYGEQWMVNQGDPNTLYFQVVDLDQVASIDIPRMPIPGLRYMVGIGMANQPYGIQVIFPSIDDRKLLSLTAVQADPNDASIWSVTIPASATPTSGNVQFQVAEGTNIRRFTVMDMIQVALTNCGAC